jgi:16S rRNA (uracil1498-N3)-methyltransferase
LRRATSHQLFYFPSGNLKVDLVEFAADETRHMLASLRLRKGDVISATDGAGTIFRVSIETVERGRATGRVLEASPGEPPRPVIRVFQGIVKPARMDFLVEKCVEMGIAGLVPVECARCVSTAGPERLERWRRIAVEAMKQSLQAWLPEIARPVKFEQALTQAAGLDTVLVATDAGERSRLGEILAPVRTARIGVWVGPEGGFTDQERAALDRAGATPFGVGQSRLRSETAALASVAVIGEIARQGTPN